MTADSDNTRTKECTLCKQDRVFIGMAKPGQRRMRVCPTCDRVGKR